MAYEKQLIQGTNKYKKGQDNKPPFDGSNPPVDKEILQSTADP